MCPPVSGPQAGRGLRLGPCMPFFGNFRYPEKERLILFQTDREMAKGEIQYQIPLVEGSGRRGSLEKTYEGGADLPGMESI